MTPFEDIPITTAVLIVKFKGQINLEVPFPLLPWCREGPPGTIQNLQYGKMIRGIPDKPPKRAAFPNTVNIIIRISHKKVNMKVCPNKLQMTGVKSTQDAIEACDGLFRLLTSLQKDIDAVKKDKDEQALHRICDRVRGAENAQVDPNDILAWLTAETTRPAIEGFDANPVDQIIFVMISKNYSIGPLEKPLGYYAKRLQGRVGVKYNNCIDHNIKVWIRDDQLDEPTENDADDELIDEVDSDSDDEYINSDECIKRPCMHKFTIHQTGQTTQNGRNLKRMEIARTKFLAIVNEIRSQ